MSIRGIRGATAAEANEAEAILAATRELLAAIVKANPTLQPEDMASIIFTMTPDLCAVHPALAARQLGWALVPLLCAQEIDVPGNVTFCIRVLIHWNTHIPQNEIQHIYLHAAVRLRPDLINKSSQTDVPMVVSENEEVSL